MIVSPGTPEVSVDPDDEEDDHEDGAGTPDVEEEHEDGLNTPDVGEDHDDDSDTPDVEEDNEDCMGTPNVDGDPEDDSDKSVECEANHDDELTTPSGNGVNQARSPGASEEGGCPGECQDAEGNPMGLALVPFIGSGKAPIPVYSLGEMLFRGKEPVLISLERSTVGP